MRDNPPIFNNLNALLVEDNPINRKMMKYTLKNIGINCDIAQNGQIGFDMRKKNSYDVIFMDIQMPIMNGIEATKAIIKYEKENNLKHIPIIAVTANAMNGNREKFLSEGMDEFISKPIDLKLFFNILEKFFKKDRINNKTILIYKKTIVEAKIIGAIVKKLGYKINIARDIDEFKNLLHSDSYHSILLDRVESDTKHKNITKILENIDTPTLLFIDNKQTIITDKDRYIYSDITYKLTSFNEIQNKILNLQKRLQSNKSSI